MRWDRFFEDLEDQLSSEWEAERAALDTEAERLRLSRVVLRDRLKGLVDRERSSSPASFELTGGTLVEAEVSGVGADWVALEPAERAGAFIVPLTALIAIRLSHAELLRTARTVPAAAPLADRMTFGFVLRDLVRRRVPVTIHLDRDRTLTGTIDRAGADHLDLALHELAAPRRTEAVTGYRIVPLTAVSAVRLDSATPLV